MWRFRGRSESHGIIGTSTVGGVRRRERGETLIEFALSLTIFLMTLLGIAEFGIAIFRYNMLSDLAQEGARRASVCGSASGLRPANPNDCDISLFVQGRSLGINPTVSTVPVNISTLVAGQTVAVTVEHTFGRLTRIIPLAPTLPLSSTAKMIVAR